MSNFGGHDGDSSIVFSLILPVSVHMGLTVLTPVVFLTISTGGAFR